MTQKEPQSNLHHLVKDDAGNVIAFSTVTAPAVISVEIDDPERLPRDGNCHWCRRKPGDIFCDGWPACFDCVELMIEQENALAIADAGGIGPEWRSEYYNPPMEWEKQ